MTQWQISQEPVPYETALERMQTRVADIAAGTADELIWLLEHPPLYTAGTSAKREDLLDAQRFPIYEAGRGGEYTYHGPGQRIAYAMLNLNERGRDLRAYVKQLEQWIILTLAEFGIEGFTREGRIGVWVEAFPAMCRSEEERSNGEGTFARSWQPAQGQSHENSHEPAIANDPIYCSPSEQKFVENKNEKKIAALGIRVRKWVSFHGIAINVNPNLSHFSGIVPCGISNYGVTSLKEMGVDASMNEVDAALQRSFEKVFG